MTKNPFAENPAFLRNLSDDEFKKLICQVDSVCENMAGEIKKRIGCANEIHETVPPDEEDPFEFDDDDSGINL